MTFIDLENRMDTQGTNYKTRGLLQDIDDNFKQLQNAINNYTFQFTTSNLAAGVLSITHALNTQYPIATLIRPDGTYEDAEAIMTKIDADNVTFDFGGAIQTGTWNGLIRIGA